MSTTIDPDIPFFLLGTGRCGTSMLRHILRRRADVSVPDETHWLTMLIEQNGLHPVPVDRHWQVLDAMQMWKGKNLLQRILVEDGIDDGALRAAVGARLDGQRGVRADAFFLAVHAAIAALKGAARFGDKTPEYGHHQQLLQRLYPGARFVHIYRDGRDVALSMDGVMTFRILAVSGLDNWHALGWKGNYQAWLPAAQAGVPIEDLYALWRRRFVRTLAESAQLTPGTVMAIRYEALLAEPAAVMQRVQEFLGLAHDQAWLDGLAGFVRSTNLDKNRDDPRYQLLTQRFSADLRGLGFDA